MCPRGGRGTERSCLVLHHSIELGSSREKYPVESGGWSAECSTGPVRFNSYKSDCDLLPRQRSVSEATGNEMCVSAGEAKLHLRATS